MEICIVQKDGSRHISRFRNLPDTDRLEIEVTIEDRGGRVVRFDLTEALLAEYARCVDLAPARIQPALPAEKVSLGTSGPSREAARASGPRKVINAKPLNELDKSAEKEAKAKKAASGRRTPSRLAKKGVAQTAGTKKADAGEATVRSRRSAKRKGATEDRLDGIGKKNGKASRAASAASGRLRVKSGQK